MPKGLGRLPSKDERDKLFPIRALLQKVTPTVRTSKYWYANGFWGNQGDTSECVGYSLTHWLEDGPCTQKGVCPIVPPADVYSVAQDLDEWDGKDYDGTSVRGGAKALQQLGFISAYHWTDDLPTMIDTLLNLSPLVIGINWYDQMFYPDSKGIIKVGGEMAGGHAIKVDGVDTVKKLFRLKNSWGRDWGKKGFCYLSFDDMERLVKEDGEVMVATEIKK